LGLYQVGARVHRHTLLGCSHLHHKVNSHGLRDFEAHAFFDLRALGQAW
jgi:hypothetical protein